MYERRRIFSRNAASARDLWDRRASDTVIPADFAFRLKERHVRDSVPSKQVRYLHALVTAL